MLLEEEGTRHNLRMPNIASALKAEISRLARKEIRGELASLKKSAAQHRTHIAALRRQIEGLENTLKKATSRAAAGWGGRKAPMLDESSGALRFRASGLASHRKRLGLSAAEFGRLIGVSGQSIYKWESGEARPRQGQLPAIAAVRKMGRREARAKLEQAR